MLELLIIFVSVFIPVQIGQTQEADRVWPRVFGLAMTILVLICSFINIVFAFMFAS